MLLHSIPRIERTEVVYEYGDWILSFSGTDPIVINSVQVMRQVDTIILSWSCDKDGCDTQQGASYAPGYNIIYRGKSMRDPFFGTYEEHYQLLGVWTIPTVVTTP